MLLGQITMYKCIKWAWLYWVALKIIIEDISLFPATCISFSIFVPPSFPSFFLFFFPLSLFFWLFFCFLFIYCPSFLLFLLPSFLPFPFSFLFCFFLFLIHVFFSSAFCSFAYNLFIGSPNSNGNGVIVTLRGFLQLPGWTTHNYNRVTDISITVFVWSEFCTITQCARYWICFPQCIL